MTLLRRAWMAAALALLLGAGALAALFILERRERALVIEKTQNVITAVRDLARLETAEYHIERVIDLREQKRHLLGLYAGEDALLLIAAGDVSAGIDLGRVSEKDFQFDLAARRAVLHLPEPEIFHARLDERRTYVHSRRTDLLVARNERLEGKARELAVSSFEEAARASGILLRARGQAERLVRALLRELGIAEVTIIWEKDPVRAE